MPFDESTWNDIVRKWEEDEPGVADVDTPPRTPRTDAPDLDVISGGQVESEPEPSPVRLRAEDSAADAPESSPTTEPAPRPPQPSSLQALDALFSKKTATAPETSSASPDWKELGDRLWNAQFRAKGSRDAEQLFANVVPGYRTDPGRFDAQVEMAKAPIDLASKRQNYEARERDENRKHVAFAVTAAMDDPNSLQSQKAREALRAQFPGIKLPTSIDNWSANDIQRWLKTGDLARLDANRATAANAARDDERAAAAAKTRADAEAGSLENERALLLRDPRAKAFGLTPDIVSRLDRKGLEGARRELDSFRAPKPQKPKPPGADTVKSGDLSTVPAELRATVRAIVEGRAKAPDPGTRFGAQILNYVTAVDPNFDSTRYGAHKKVEETQATGKDRLAIDVALEHLKTAESLIPDNTDIRRLNELKQAFSSGSGDPKYTAFVAASTVAAHEVASVYGIDDQAGKAMVEHMMAAAQSPAQLRAVFSTIHELVSGKQKGLAKQRAATGPTHFGEADEPMVTVVKKKTGSTKQMPKSKADALLSAPGGDAYEVR